MTDKILNNALKGLLLANKTIPPLEPVLQYRAGAQGDSFQFLDMLLEFCVGHSAHGGVSGCAQAADSRQIQFWRWRCAAAGSF